MAEEYMTAYHFTKCDKGSREEYINLPVDHGVISMTTGYPLLNANDHRYEGENKNIRGYCSCKVIGQCRPLTPKVWESTAKKHLIEGAPALTENSKLKCMYGGTISFCDPPADVQKKMQEQEDAEKKAQELHADALNRQEQRYQERRQSETALYEKVGEIGSQFTTGVGKHHLGIHQFPFTSRLYHRLVCRTCREIRDEGYQHIDGQGNDDEADEYPQNLV